MEKHSKKCIKLKSDYLFLQNTTRDFMLTYEFSCLEQCDKMPWGLQIPVFNNKWCIFNPSFMLLEIKEIPGRQHWMVAAAAESLLSLSSFGFRSQSTKQQTFPSKMREKFSQQSCCQKPSAARSRVPVTHFLQLPTTALLSDSTKAEVKCPELARRHKECKKHLQGNFRSTGMNYILNFSKMYFILL